MSNPVLCDVTGGIAILTLNRPDKLNAIKTRTNQIEIHEDTLRATIGILMPDLEQILRTIRRVNRLQIEHDVEQRTSVLEYKMEQAFVVY